MTLEERLRDLLMDGGADLVGFAKVEGKYDSCAESIPDFPRYPHAVSIGVAVPKKVILGIDQGPTMEYWEAYHELNTKLDSLNRLCAEALRASGANVWGQTTDVVEEYDVYRTPLPHKTAAVWAGLGFIGKSALFVSPKYGSAVRLSSVLTDAPLHCWMGQPVSLCGDCTRCTDSCPGHAVSGKRWEAGMKREELFDPLKCRPAARKLAKDLLDKEITLCGKCIQVCPFTQRYLREE
ncbi:MAG: 4Fe-4S double cluster binding domain-containing protein [Eubacteriales bacterium]|nr:4Fe-4S double cluster binding domain-containing protein [Eubacteriales bacterium]